MLSSAGSQASDTTGWKEQVAAALEEAQDACEFELLCAAIVQELPASSCSTRQEQKQSEECELSRKRKKESAADETARSRRRCRAVSAPSQQLDGTYQEEEDDRDEHNEDEENDDEEQEERGCNGSACLSAGSSERFRRNGIRFVRCACGREMLASNLARHQRSCKFLQGTNEKSGTLVDALCGIFFVFFGRYVR